MRKRLFKRDGVRYNNCHKGPDLPFRVDVVQWCKISTEFKKVIQPQLQSIKAALS